VTAPVTGRGSGKLILLGEHAVVHGHMAVAVGVSLGTEVVLHPAKGPTHLAQDHADPRLREALALVLPPEGFRVEIRSDLPEGRGMGSSAALAVALVRARAALKGEDLSFAAVHEQAFGVERLFHGNPSGLDHAVAAMGGALSYRKGEAPVPREMPPVAAVVLDTGRAGNTAEIVAAVAARRPGVDPLLARLGVLAEEMAPCLGDTQALGAALIEAHALLREVGVSDDELDSLVALARAHGAVGAKLSGAGRGGVVLALVPEGPEPLLQAAAARGISAFSCTVPDK
jgi:mevalonate kinase